MDFPHLDTVAQLGKRATETYLWDDVWAYSKSRCGLLCLTSKPCFEVTPATLMERETPHLLVGIELKLSLRKYQKLGRLRLHLLA